MRKVRLRMVGHTRTRTLDQRTARSPFDTALPATRQTSDSGVGRSAGLEPLSKLLLPDGTRLPGAGPNQLTGGSAPENACPTVGDARSVAVHHSAPILLVTDGHVAERQMRLDGGKHNEEQ